MQRALTFSAAVLLAMPALAATRTWNGSASNLWSNPANWGGTLPAAGDDLVFPTAANMVNTNDLPGGTVFRSITFTGGPYTITGIFIGLSNGISSTAIGVENVLNIFITLTASQTWSTAVLSEQTVYSFDVNGRTLTLAPTPVRCPSPGSATTPSARSSRPAPVTPRSDHRTTTARSSSTMDSSSTTPATPQVSP